MEFVVALADHLAWPLVVVGALVGFRRSLRALVSRLESWEGLGQKFSFGRKLVEAGKRAERVTSQVEHKLAEEDQQSPPENADLFSALARDAAENPSYSITAGWDALLGALRDLIDNVSPQLEQRDQPIRTVNEIPALQMLLYRHFVNADFVSAVHDLRHLRNKVAHGQHKPTPDEAVSYVESARELARASQVLANLAAQRGKR
jgi:hypothetical protein